MDNFFLKKCAEKDECNLIFNLLILILNFSKDFIKKPNGRI